MKNSCSSVCLTERKAVIYILSYCSDVDGFPLYPYLEQHHRNLMMAGATYLVTKVGGWKSLHLSLTEQEICQ